MMLRDLLASMRDGAALYLLVRTEQPATLELPLLNRSDMEALAADFAAVGNDLRSAMRDLPLSK